MAIEKVAGNGASEIPAKQCNLRLLYLQDVSFESPHVPGVLFGHAQPELRFSVESRHRMRDKDTYEVVLELHVHAMAGDKTLFLIEVKQGGVFEITGYSTDLIAQILKSKAPETLYPYARELVSSLVSRGGFPRLQLQPLDFDRLYAEALQRRKEEA